MTASNSKGVTIRVVNPTAVATDVTPTTISAAKPAVVDVAATTGLAEGDLIFVPTGATGMPSLDGKWFTVGNIVAATSFTLVGSDTTGETYTAGADPELKHYGIQAGTTLLCWSSMTFNIGAPTTISTATFCDPSASVPGVVVEAGTVDFAGYVDISSTDYPLLDKMFQDGGEHIFRIHLPKNGDIVFRGTIGSFGLDVPIDGAIGYSGSITLASKPVHIY